MQNAPPNKLFNSSYRQKWPRAADAWAHLERCLERTNLLTIRYGADDPRTQAADAAMRRAKAHYDAAVREDEKAAAVAGG